MTPNIKTVFKPLPGSQALALSCDCSQILYEGSRGNGKSLIQLAYFRRFVNVGYGSHWKGIIFDQKYKSLNDLISKSKRLFPPFNDGAKFIAGAGLKWVWPGGEELIFACYPRDDSYQDFHGNEYAFIGVNELTKFATPRILDDMATTLRSGFVPTEHTPQNADGTYATPTGEPLPEIPLTIFCTTNSHGPGRNWVKRRFVDPAPPGKILRKTTKIFNPKTKKEEEIEQTQVRIFGSYKENPYLSPQYIAELESILDDNKRKSWLEGSWDVTTGGALDDLWQFDIHVVPPFDIPSDWYVDRCLDWGSSHPFSVGWYAESNGEEVTLSDGSTKVFPAGSIIRFAEWYGSNEIGTNNGMRLGSSEVALGILQREQEMITQGIIQQEPQGGVADSQIFGTLDRSTKSIATIMSEEGVEWLPANKSQGTRKSGLELIRQRLNNAINNEGPGLFFTTACPAAIETLPVLPRSEKDPDDVDTTAEDHIYDEVRYKCLDNPLRIPSQDDLTVVFPR